MGESGKLFGSITQQMIAEAISEKIGAEVDRHRVESQPLREEGEHMVKIRLTFDLIPEVKVAVESEEETEEQKKHPEKSAAVPEKLRKRKPKWERNRWDLKFWNPKPQNPKPLPKKRKANPQKKKADPQKNHNQTFIKVIRPALILQAGL